jgi:hypothetical protein
VGRLQEGLPVCDFEHWLCGSHNCFPFVSHVDFLMSCGPGEVKPLVCGGRVGEEGPAEVGPPSLSVLFLFCMQSLNCE